MPWSPPINWTQKWTAGATNCWSASPTVLRVIKAAFVSEFEDLLGKGDSHRRMIVRPDFWATERRENVRLRGKAKARFRRFLQAANQLLTHPIWRQMNMSSPLSHIRVLDLVANLPVRGRRRCWPTSAPTSSRWRRPKVGDDMRHYGPPWVKTAEGQDTKECPFFLAANRGKRSVTIDIASKEGQDLIRRMVPHCDVVIENYRVGTPVAWPGL